MYKTICVTNRKICGEDFLNRIYKIAVEQPTAIILREKDLDEEEYYRLAKEVLDIAKKTGANIILHSFSDVCRRLEHRKIHMPLDRLVQMSSREIAYFDTVGASCHSVEDAVCAQKMGCTYITAGHIFETDCKKGLPGRGLDFLGEVCRAVDIPVYAIGGMNEKNAELAVNAGAEGICIMSSAMR